MPVVNSLEELQEILETERKKGKTIVTTNGCFDIIHVGHVRYLAEAKRIGDILVVGINSDASVKKIKGDNRPIVPQQERAEIIAALRCVDYTFVFNEPNPTGFLEVLKPHFHAKGGDYAMDRIVERKTVESNNGRVVLLTNIEGRSTTDMLNRIWPKT